MGNWGLGELEEVRGLGIRGPTKGQEGREQELSPQETRGMWVGDKDPSVPLLGAPYWEEGFVGAGSRVKVGTETGQD